MNRENFAFGKINFILLAVGVLVIILGFILMSGSSSSETTFNPEIFSVTRIKSGTYCVRYRLCFNYFRYNEEAKQHKRIIEV